MKHVLLIYETAENLQSRRHPETDPYTAAWRAYYKAVVAAGIYEGGAPLKEEATATVVRLENGKRYVQDGPFAESKEQLGGFMILDVPSLDEALQWAARCPAAATGSVEVRPMDVESHEHVVGPSPDRSRIDRAG